MTVVLLSEDLKLRYACPACGHLFCESMYLSFTVRGARWFTDGFCWNTFLDSGFIQCRGCENVFNKKYLKELSEEEIVEQSAVANSNIISGSVDGDFFSCRFQGHNVYSKHWWEFFNNELYFPFDIDLDERNEVRKRFNLTAWRKIHYRHYNWVMESKLTMENYNNIRERLFDFCCYSDELEDLLVTAELFRNDEDFDGCFDFLQRIDNIRAENGDKDEKSRVLFGICETIRGAALNEIAITLPISKWLMY